MRVGNKKIFHLEAWVVKVMSLYKVRAPRCPVSCPASPLAVVVAAGDQHHYCVVSVAIDADVEPSLAAFLLRLRHGGRLRRFLSALGRESLHYHRYRQSLCHARIETPPGVARGVVL